MKNASQLVLEKIIENGGFASKVATTVISSGNCSCKQYEILDEAAAKLDLFIELTELQNIDITNIRHDHAFEAKQALSLKMQMSAL